MYGIDNYPKNYHASGIGLVNLAALGYSKNEVSGGGADTTKKAGLYPSLPYPSSESVGGMPYVVKQQAIHSQNASYPGMGVATSMPMPGYPSAAPYSGGGGLYPSLPSASSSLPYPSAPMAPMTPSFYPSMPQPGLPYPSAPLAPMPAAFPSMPMPYAPLPMSPAPQQAMGFPSLPYPTAPPPASAPTQEEEPSVGIAELSFTSVKVPENQNMFWMGRKATSTRQTSIRGDDFASLRDSCVGSGTLFEDPDFPANNASLMFSKRPDRYIEWRRPAEIVDDPQFFVEGYSRFDVQQGELGDCWLLAAAANLTQDSTLFFRVIPPDQDFQENYAGIFHFKFWQYGKWVEVVIDDRLPTYNGELIYMHSTERNEFWSALLEKAYAKLHGSYEALKGGTTCEAMEDFTGGVTEWYDIKEAPPNLFSIMMKAAERGSMMGCSLEPDPHVLEAETREGLIRGHAYSITKVCLMDISTPNRQGKLPMIRMRNPWGNDAEWSGPWSDSSPEWRFIPEHTKDEIGLNFDRDGEFWMSFQDFLNHFDRVEICNLNPDSLTEDQQNSSRRKWEMSMFEGEWTSGVTAGGCRNFLETFWHNPQYVISLEDPDDEDDDGKCTVIVALMQKNRRSKRNVGIDCLTIGFAIYHLTDRDLQVKPQSLNFFKYRASVARSPHFINTREVCARFKLPPGHYLIVPSTFDPNEEGEFIIRVFSETMNNMEENDDEVGFGETDYRIAPALPPPTPKEEDDPQRIALRRLFDSVAGSDEEVDWQELKRILDHSMRDVMVGTDGFSKDAVRSMVAMLDKDRSGRLGFDEFEALLTDIAKWRAVFKLYDTRRTGSIDGFHLRGALNSAGYHLNNRLLNALAHRYGSREGQIPFDDFLMCAIKVRTFIEMFRERDTDNSDTAFFNLDDWLERTIYS
ncbi:calpain-B [Drosophila guanche]|uniref:Blast:Calpain-B n=1 Tax=Drosophila guanche TaxID=7266 RepID=A0A3B0JAG7_DROGU|nr:calpain-B [Drosophila guanche]SPP76982.1 blast:Calpain-B [Drosophila guanche]